MNLFRRGSESDKAIASLVSQEEHRRLYAAFTKRRKRANRINCAWHGAGFKDMVEARLGSKYHKETYNALTLQSGTVTHNRVMQDVVGKGNTEWPEGARYWIHRGGSEAEGDDAVRFNNHIRMADYDSLMRSVSTMCWLHDGIAVMPQVTFQPRTGRRRFHHVMLTPEHFDLEPNPNDSTDFIRFSVYEDGPTQDPVRKTTWTANEWVRYELRGGNGLGGGEWVETKRGVSDVGQIPAVIFYGEPPATGLWGPSFGDMLTDVMIDVNVAETFLAYMQSCQIKVLIGPAEKFPSGQIFAPATVLDSGGAGDMQLVDFSTDIAAYRTTFIDAPRKQALVATGQHGDEFDPSATPASGEALKIKRFNAQQIARRRRENLKPKVVELYHLDLRVLWFQLQYKEVGGDYDKIVLPISGYEGAWKGGDLSTFSPPDAATVLPPYEENVHWAKQEWSFGIDVIEPTIPELMTEMVAREQYEISEGFTNHGELMSQRNPDLRGEDAVQSVRKNRAITESFKRAAPVRGLSSLMPPPKPKQEPTEDTKPPAKDA